VEPVFSAVASFGIGAIANFLSGSRQGIQIGGADNLVLMIRLLERRLRQAQGTGLAFSCWARHARCRKPALRGAMALQNDAG
jgi:hypothetical protein